MPPKTRYARCGDLSLAYQVVGEGDIDIVLVPSFVSHIEFHWGHPAIKSFFDRVTSFARLAIFDKAGTGLSDPVSGIPTIEERAQEVEAVMDAAGMERAAVFGLSEGGPTAIFYSVTRRKRTTALVLFGTFTAGMRSLEALAEREDLSADQLDRLGRFVGHVLNDWGEGKALKLLLPNQGDEAQLGMIERLAASPAMARATLLSGTRLDVTDLLESVDVPTLVVHAKDDLVPVQNAHLMATKIPGARLLEVDGADHAPWLSSPDQIVGEIEELLTGHRHAPAPTRVLATVLFTDIVGSTERAAELGDARWRAVLERHDAVTRRLVAEAGGTAVKSTGDGHLATFTGPAAAIRCTEAIRDALAREGVEIRAGLHAGEVEQLGEDVGGLGVHIAARVCAHAGPGEILVSRTIRDLVVGSGLAFEPRGTHELKGVPGVWELLAVAATPPAGPDADPVAGLEVDGPRSSQRRTDRVVAAVARRAPGAIRAAMLADPRYRRSVGGR
jgi:class 3 adenylate cyclase